MRFPTSLGYVFFYRILQYRNDDSRGVGLTGGETLSNVFHWQLLEEVAEESLADVEAAGEKLSFGGGSEVVAVTLALGVVAVAAAIGGGSVPALFVSMTHTSEDQSSTEGSYSCLRSEV